MNQRIFSIIIFIALAIALLAQSSQKPQERNASITGEGEDGTPTAAIFTAASDGSIATIDEALRRGVRVDARNEFGWTPLMIAVFYQQDAAARWLIRHGANVNAACATCVTPLMLASRTGDQAIVDDLIEAHAELHAVDSAGRNALMFAAECEGGAEVMKDLLVRGLPPDSADQDGQTPLMDAVGSGNLRIASILLGHGANLHAKDRAGHTPLDLANIEHDVPMAAFLSQHESAHRIH